MTAIILTGAVAVEQNIIGLTDGFAPVRVFPDPLSKSVFNEFLLALGDGRLFLVQNGNSAPFLIVLVIKNADILQVKCRFDDLIGVDALCAVGTDGLHIAAILALALNTPLAGDAGIVDLHTPLRAAGCSQRFKNKPADIFGVQPCSAQPDGDLAGGEVGGLHLRERIGVDLILRVLLRLALGNRQFLTHIAGKILVRGQVFLMSIVLAGVSGVQKNHALEIRKQRFFVLAGEPAHIVHIHMSLFPDGQRQRLHRCVYLFSRFVAADGALGEQVSLPFQVPVLVQNFQRTEQEVRAVLIEGDGVAAGVDESIFPGEGVIESIQLCLLRLDFFIGIVLGLIFQQRPHTVPQLDHAADSALCRLGYLHRVHTAVFPVVDLVVHQRIGKIADSRVGLNGMILALQFFLPVIGGDLAVNILNGLRQQCFQRLLRVRLAGRRGAERPGHHLHLAQDHIRVVDEVAVHLDAVLVGGKVYPFRFYIHHSFPLLQKQNV